MKDKIFKVIGTIIKKFPSTAADYTGLMNSILKNLQNEISWQSGSVTIEGYFSCLSDYLQNFPFPEGSNDLEILYKCIKSMVIPSNYKKVSNRGKCL